MILRNGSPAPPFTLSDADGGRHALEDIRAGSKPTIVFFFRGEFCETSWQLLLNYRNIYSRIRAVGGELVAICCDPPDRLRALRMRLGLDFLLLSDPGFAVSGQYGVYPSDEPEADYPHGEPATFLLDVDGRVAYAQVQTGPRGTASPEEMALVLLHMSQNGGRY